MDDWKAEWERRHGDFLDLPNETRVKLALACLARDNRRDEGLSILRKQYPDAPEELILSGTYHLYWKLPGALRDTLAQIELSLQEGDADLHWGVISDALYHLYNWLQVHALVPWGKKSVWNELEEVRDLVRQDDKDGALSTLKQLMDQISGDAKYPEIE